MHRPSRQGRRELGPDRRLRFAGPWAGIYHPCYWRSFWTRSPALWECVMGSDVDEPPGQAEAGGRVWGQRPHTAHERRARSSISPTSLLGALGRPFDHRSPFFMGLTGALGVGVAYVLFRGVADISSVLVIIGLPCSSQSGWIRSSSSRRPRPRPRRGRRPRDARIRARDRLVRPRRGAHRSPTRSRLW